MSGRPTIWFVRHGQTDWNVQGRLQGWRDTPLNDHGRVQAAEAGRRLRRVAGPGLDGAAFLASPLRRAQESMAILRGALDLPAEGFRTEPGLREIGFGDWEGLTWAEIRRRDPAGAVARDRDRWGYRPGGLHAESYAMLAERAGAAVRTLDRPAVIVSHGGVARALLVVLGLVDVGTAMRASIRQGRVLVLDAHGWRWS